METTEESVSVNKLISDFKLVVQDAESLLRATADDLGGKLGEKAQEARSRLTSSLESAKASCHGLEAKAVAGARATDKIIRENPYQSLGIALGLGFLFGIILTRR